MKRAVAILALTAGPAFAGEGTFHVTDGDTVVLERPGEPVEKIRLENIDAPEIGHPGCSSERDMGLRAAARLLAIIEGGDVTVARVGRIDRYERTIARLQVGGRDVGEILVSEGLARPWRGHKEDWCGGGAAQ